MLLDELLTGREEKIKDWLSSQNLIKICSCKRIIFDPDKINHFIKEKFGSEGIIRAKEIFIWVCNLNNKFSWSYIFENENGLSVCSDCKKNNEILPGKSSKLRDFLNDYKFPVIAVDPDGTVITANDSAAGALKKNINELENSMNGDIFECIYSKTQEGCGNTVHCNGCKIRHLIEYTVKTGKSRTREPAFYYKIINNQNTPEKIDIRLSTELFGDSVFLMIEEIV